jgi:RimJ/RimL family protein N-acetyltransferase
MILYETENFNLVPFTELFGKTNDYDSNYQNWFNDPEVTKYNSHGLFPYTDEQKEEFFKNIDINTNLQLPNTIVWAITSFYPSSFINKTGSKTYHIGNITLQNINWINRSAEFAIVIGEKEYWGKGLGYEAAKILFNHGFNKLNLNRIWTGTAETNISMNKLALKLGMRKEGEFKEGMYLEGEYVDINCYGILKGGWFNG